MVYTDDVRVEAPAVTPRMRATFAALIAIQAAHSAEEYWFRLWEQLAPARLVSRVLSTDLPTGFLLANIAIVAFGAWCYFARVRHGHPSSRGLSWFWGLLEVSNGIGHLILALLQGGYFPGAATAPFLLAAGGLLVLDLERSAPGARR